MKNVFQDLDFSHDLDHFALFSCRLYGEEVRGVIKIMSKIMIKKGGLHRTNPCKVKGMIVGRTDGAEER